MPKRANFAILVVLTMAQLMEIKPYSDASSDKKEQVAIMFDRIAFRYDLLNHLLSFNIDRYWRKKLVRLIGRHHPATILDIAAGTGDLSLLAAARLHVPVVASDFSQEMLRIAERKIREKGYGNLIKCVPADAEALPFDSDSFDAVMVAFGVRNFSNPEKGLLEMFRVVSPGGIVAILEFSVPRIPFFRTLYLFYFRRIIPLIGRIVSGDSQAYRYLNASAEAFPGPDVFCRMLGNAGFSSVISLSLTGGIATIYMGIKPRNPEVF